MLAKLTPDILDRLDIFVMEIEELQIPQPLWWEYTWCFSILSSFIGLSAAKGNKIREMKKFMVLISVFGILPIVYCLLHYFSNVWDFLFLEEGNNLDEAGIFLWKVIHRNNNTIFTNFFFLGFSLLYSLVCVLYNWISNTFFYNSIFVEFIKSLECTYCR